jgi:hypothetical protein
MQCTFCDTSNEFASYFEWITGLSALNLFVFGRDDVGFFLFNFLLLRIRYTKLNSSFQNYCLRPTIFLLHALINNQMEFISIHVRSEIITGVMLKTVYVFL